MHNNTNECIILDCALNSVTLLPLIIDNTKEIDYYNNNHQQIYVLIKELYDKNIKVSISSVMKLAMEKNLDINIREILGSWSGTDIKPFIESLQDDSNRRQIIQLFAENKEKLTNRNNSIDSIAVEAENKIREITANKISPITFMKDMATGDIMDLGSDKRARKTGYTELDHNLWGISGGELIILAGVTSQGKSASAGNIATFVADKYEDHVLWFSLEMPKEQMRRRWVGQFAEYDNFLIKRKKFETPEVIEKVRQAMNRVDSLPIGIVDRKFEIKEITAISRRFSHKQKISLIVVDYLQLISNYIHSSTLAQQVGDSIKQLKDLAMELDVPLICLSQFSRKAEREEFPDLSWLKETSTAEQAADMVWFLHRYSDKQKAKEAEDSNADYLNSVANLYRFIVAKNRDGKANFYINMEYLAEYTTFRCI